MNMMKKICIFDLDGTLINSIGDISAAVNASLQKMGLPPHSEDAYKQMVGNGMYRLCAEALPSDAKDRTQELVALYQDAYLKNCCVRTKPYPGIPEVISKLTGSGRICGILSNKPHVQTLQIAGQLFSDSAFAVIQGQTDGVPCKPAPDALLGLLRKFSAERRAAVYIGDSDVDIQLGQNTDIDTIGVSWGFRGKQELLDAGAAHIADTPADLYEQIINFK